MSVDVRVRPSRDAGSIPAASTTDSKADYLRRRTARRGDLAGRWCFGLWVKVLRRWELWGEGKLGTRWGADRPGFTTNGGFERLCI